MNSPLDDVCCASIPAEALGMLAPLRCEPGVTVTAAEGRVWVRWDAGNDAVLRTVAPIPGCRLHVFREGAWFVLGKHLPAEVPSADFRPLYQVLFPAPLQAVAVPAAKARPATLTLATSDLPRPATALRCALDVLSHWMDTVSSIRIGSLRAAHCGADVLVVGKKLPELASGRRYWGERVLVPLGTCVQPALPESGLCAALGLEDDDIALFEEGGIEVLSRAALMPLSRAGLRLAVKHM